MTDYGVTLQDIYQARSRLTPLVRRTPLIFSQPLSELTGRQAFLKLESLQETGSFKVRGATNALMNLTPEQKEKGVIAFSTGNHGRAVAYVAEKLGIKSVICLSQRVPQYRVQALEALGAEVVRHGQSQDEAYTKAIALQQEQGLTMVKPFDDPLVLAGQGTIGLELLEDLSDIDTVLVPLSGGGLMAGIAFVLKSACPRIKVVGLSLEVSAPMYQSLQAGRPVEIEEKASLGDALLGGIGLDNRYTFPLCRDLVDEVILISEQEIATGLSYAFHNHRLVVEGAGIVGLSALISGKTSHLGHRVAVILSGGNMDTKALTQIAMERYVGGNNMKRQAIYTDKAPEPGPYSQAIKYNDLVFVSGQTSDDPVTHEPIQDSIASQTERILTHIKYILEEAGSGLDQVLKVNVYLSAWEHKEEMNRVYRTFFPKDPPARIAMAVQGLDAGLDVEIDCIAHV